MANDRLEHANRLTACLGERLGLADLSLDAQGAKSLTLDGRLFTLQYVDWNDCFYFISPLGELPEDREAQFAALAFLMDQNCFFRGTGSGVLGVRQGERSVSYTARLPCDGLGFEDFELFFQGLVDACEQIAARLAKALATQTEGAAETTAPPGIPGFALRV
jgi:hypothetical protein